MLGYGWSIWYVPDDWKKIMTKYGMTHIPHLTIQTNILEKPTTFGASFYLKSIRFNSPVIEFESQYDNDPLSAKGWLCEIPTWWNYPHKPHVTWKYNADDRCPRDNPIQFDDLKLVIADTRSFDPSTWYFHHLSGELVRPECP